MTFTTHYLKRFLAILVLAICCNVTIARASHIAAMDLYVTYVGDVDKCTGKASLDYEVTLTLYNACERTTVAWFGTPENVYYQSANGGTGQLQLTVDAILEDGSPVPPGYDGTVVHSLCPAYDNLNSCIIPTNDLKYPGYIRWRYKAKLTLPSAQTDWRFWWSGGARNTGIINLATKNTAYIEAGINNVARFDVSTPRFTSNPLPYICVNVPFKYLNAPVDPDVRKDQNNTIIYAHAPMNGFGTYDVFNAGYGANNPTGNPMTVDPVSGTAEFVPNGTGPHVLAFQADKYDRSSGVRVAYTMRDVQVSILECESPAPAIDTIPNNLVNATWKVVNDDGDSAIYVCPGSEMSFDINAKSATDTSKTYWETNSAQFQGATFTSSGEGTPKINGVFKWTPSLRDLGDNTFIAIAKDSTCSPTVPIVLRTPTVFVIRVTQGLDAGADLPTCQFNDKGYQVLVRGTEHKLRVNWSRLDGSGTEGISDPASISPVIRAAGNTQFLVTTPDLVATCKARDTLAFVVDNQNYMTITPNTPSIKKDSNDYVLCMPDYLQMEAVFNGRPPLTNLSCGIVDQKNNREIKCDKPDSALIYGSFVYESKKTYDTIGPTTPTFSNLVLSSKQQIFISREELQRYGLVSSSLKGLHFSVDTAGAPDHEYSNFKISLKCTPKLALDPKDGFETGMSTVYEATGPIKFPEGWHQFMFDTTYNYDSTKGLIVEFCYSNNAGVDICYSPGLKFSPTNYVSTLINTPNDAVTPDVCGATAVTSSTYVRPVLGFVYCDAPPAVITYRWFPGVFLSDSTLQQPLAYVPKSTQYIVESFGRNNCKIYDTINVYIPEHNWAISNDTTICFGESAPTKVKGGFDYNWFEYKDGKYISATKTASCLKCNDPILKPLETTIYKAVVYDSVWCIDTLTRIVNVLPLPDVRVITNDTVIKYGQSVQLLASGSRKYAWSPAGSLSNATISNPVGRPTERTEYIVGGIGSNGCRAFDTVIVDVDFKDNLFIPSGFSPNGDGKNDMFRVANLTFQRVQEFRVFNRWGQEVYSNNGNSGWDGMWKGEPQDLGTYQYQIKVGLPDGTVEVFKGDVILVR